jgi:uncharacterized membrane protein YidH (DUF202 family)
MTTYLNKMFKLSTVVAIAVTAMMASIVGVSAAVNYTCTNGSSGSAPTVATIPTGCSQVTSGSGATTCTPVAGEQLGTNCADPNTTGKINDAIYKFSATIAFIVLGIGVLMIVYAGFKYATSQGDPKTTEQAKMQIIAAGVGIGIAMFAFVILQIFKSSLG